MNTLDNPFLKTRITSRVGCKAFIMLGEGKYILKINLENNYGYPFIHRFLMQLASSQAEGFSSSL